MRQGKKRLLALLFSLILLAGILGGCGGTVASPADSASTTVASTESAAEPTASEEVASDKPAAWIADRHIVGRSFIDDQGGTFPEDFENNPVALKIKELTGITIEWQYTAGTSDLDVMTTAMVAGDLPDDTKNGVMFRPEFNGATYLVHINIPRAPGSNWLVFLGSTDIDNVIDFGELTYGQNANPTIMIGRCSSMTSTNRQKSATRRALMPVDSFRIFPKWSRI